MSKPYEPIDKQIERLKSRGLVINNLDLAKKILMRENYYSVINGYKDLFILDDPENFIVGTTFEEIYSLYSFDRELRNILIGYLLKFENIIKSVITDYFCAAHPEETAPYLDYKNYDKSQNNKVFTIAKLIATLANIIQQEEKKEGAVDHYLTKYNHVPLWVLKNFMTFGNIQWMYSFLKQPLKRTIAKHFAQEFKDDYKEDYNEQYFFDESIILSVLKTSNFFRNICAHEERLYNFKMKRKPEVTQIAQILDINSTIISNGNLFTLITSLKIVLEKKDFYELGEKLKKLFEKYENEFQIVTFESIRDVMGFPEDWVSLLVKDTQTSSTVESL